MTKTKLTDLVAMGEIYFALCKRLDSPVTLACWLLFKYGEHEQLARKKVKPDHYVSMQRFRDDYLATSYLSKWVGLETGIDREAVALEAFATSEAQCAETNRRLRKALTGDVNHRVEPILHLALRKIDAMLGVPDWRRCLERCDWGKGATATLTSEVANLVRKIDPGKGRISVTRAALATIKLIISSDPHWAEAILKKEVVGPFSLLDREVFEVIEGNKVVTVPKDATKDRTIAKEPTANIFMQLGVGREFRRLLKRSGIDLDDQSHNQRGAHHGSLTGEYATVDMKSASDTVSKELVKQLFSMEWFDLLNHLRSPKGAVDGGPWFEYEKFSSMGNGFTFELETIIFYALAVAVVQHYGHGGRVLVYGDDVILPSAAYQQYLEVLQYCGFQVNTEKSYAHGHFRESCGSHYWAGTDVTPIYQKEGLTRGQEVDLPEAYRCANRILRLAWRRGHFLWFDDVLQGSWQTTRRVLGLERDQVRHAIPLGTEDDDGLMLEMSELQFFIMRSGHGRIKLPVLSFRPRKLKIPSFYQGALLAYWFRQRAKTAKLLSARYPERVMSGRGWVTAERAQKAFSATWLPSYAVEDEPFEGQVSVRRRGYYVSRRRTYPIGTPYVAWL